MLRRSHFLGNSLNRTSRNVTSIILNLCNVIFCKRKSRKYFLVLYPSNKCLPIGRLLVTYTGLLQIIGVNTNSQKQQEIPPPRYSFLQFHGNISDSTCKLCKRNLQIQPRRQNSGKIKNNLLQKS